MSTPRDIWTPGRKERPFAEVEPDPRRLIHLPDGRVFVDNTVTISLEDAQRMWQGYKCAACLEPFTEANPEACPLCGFPVRAEQRKQLEERFLGVDPTQVSGFPLDRELDHLDREYYKPKGLMTKPKEI